MKPKYKQRQWYYYQLPNCDPSLMTGHEVWLPGNYYFDVDAGEFFFDNEGKPEKASVAQLRKAAVRGTPAYIIPFSIIVVGFLGAGYIFNLNYLDDYSAYLAEQSEQQNALMAFNPYAGMCRLNDKNSLIPNLMTVQVAYNLPEGSSPPFAIEALYYLEGDELSTPTGNITLPSQLFLHDSPELIVGDSASDINFRNRATGDNCIDGNTIFLASEPGSGEATAYLVPVDDLKSIFLGESSGSYESKLFGRYDSTYMVNLSSYDLRIKEFRYAVDDLPGCNTISAQEILPPDYQGLGDGFRGEIVPWGTPMTETINLPNFQSCSSIFHLEYQ